MKICIIGGAGYIGSHTAREFLDAGHEVTVYDNLSSGLRQNLFPEEKFIHGDIRDYPALVAALSGTPFEVIVYLAAYKAAGESMIVPQKYSLNNISGTVNILNAALECGVKYLIFSSSAAVYGEPKYLPIDEAHPTEPENYYGWTKLEIEKMLGWYDRLKNLKFAALRYFNAAGYDVQGRITGREFNPANLIPIVMETAAGIRKKLTVFGTDYKTPDGTCIRDYIHVNDLASAHVMALNTLAKTGKSLTVNLGTGKGSSVLEVLDAARKITGKEIPAEMGPRRPGDPDELYAASKLAKDLMGWEAKHSDLKTIIETSWKVYK
ncbi:MAG: UDP-glucose 4-epimerase GalE [Spirochaetaceae bacterium]|jgi:UDP-glucose 4-epimerase|nr:UDP-glucose 4-epimerase GalE [Spirochaetaceae bacterium]